MIGNVPEDVDFLNIEEFVRRYEDGEIDSDDVDLEEFEEGISYLGSL